MCGFLAAACFTKAHYVTAVSKAILFRVCPLTFSCWARLSRHFAVKALPGDSSRLLGLLVAGDFGELPRASVASLEKVPARELTFKALPGDGLGFVGLLVVGNICEGPHATALKKVPAGELALKALPVDGLGFVGLLVVGNICEGPRASVASLEKVPVCRHTMLCVKVACKTVNPSRFTVNTVSNWHLACKNVAFAAIRGVR